MGHKTMSKPKKAAKKKPGTAKSDGPRASFAGRHDDDVVDRRTFAELAGIAYRTAEDMARDGRGPPMIRTGPIKGRCLYQIKDIKQWLESCKLDPAQAAPAGVAALRPRTARTGRSPRLPIPENPC